MTTPSYQDFTLKPFSKRSNARALLQISNTLIPYGLLWWLMLQAAAVSLWLTPPFPDFSQLILAKKFFTDARLRSWVAV